MNTIWDRNDTDQGSIDEIKGACYINFIAGDWDTLNWMIWKVAYDDNSYGYEAVARVDGQVVSYIRATEEEARDVIKSLNP